MSVNDGTQLFGPLLDPRQLAQLAPSVRMGRRVSPATLKRWMRQGLHGERLSYVMVGVQPCTTEAELLSFFRRLALADANRRFAGEGCGGGKAAGTKSAKAKDQRLALDNQQARELGL